MKHRYVGTLTVNKNERRVYMALMLSYSISLNVYTDGIIFIYDAKDKYAGLINVGPYWYEIEAQ